MFATAERCPGALRIADFGMSFEAAGSARACTRDEAAGTEAYMAPEVRAPCRAVATGGPDILQARDMWSLGLTFDLILRRDGDGCRGPAELLKPVVTQMMSRNPADRPTAAEVLRELVRLSQSDS